MRSKKVSAILPLLAKESNYAHECQSSERKKRRVRIPRGRFSIENFTLFLTVYQFCFFTFTFSIIQLLYHGYSNDPKQ